MSTLTIDNLTYDRLPGADGTFLNVAHGGKGAPVVLLHGFPQTHLKWRHVATDLVRDHTVVVPDLRGYGESDKPDAIAPTMYSKRTIAPGHHQRHASPGPREIRSRGARPWRPCRRSGRPGPP